MLIINVEEEMEKSKHEIDKLVNDRKLGRGSMNPEHRRLGAGFEIAVMKFLGQDTLKWKQETYDKPDIVFGSIPIEAKALFPGKNYITIRNHEWKRYRGRVVIGGLQIKHGLYVLLGFDTVENIYRRKDELKKIPFYDNAGNCDGVGNCVPVDSLRGMEQWDEFVEAWRN